MSEATGLTVAAFDAGASTLAVDVGRRLSADAGVAGNARMAIVFVPTGRKGLREVEAIEGWEDRPVLPVVWDPPVVAIGPVYGPGLGACLRCLPPGGSDVDTIIAPDRAAGHLGVHVTMLAAVCRSLAQDWCAADDASVRRIRRLDLATLTMSAHPAPPCRCRRRHGR